MGIFPPCSSSEMLEKLLGTVCGKIRDSPQIEKRKIKGTVVLRKKNFMGMTDVGASFLDRVYEIFRKGVSLQLISATHADPENGSRGKLGKEAYLESWGSKFTSLSANEDATFNITFDWDESMGVPGAFLIKNHHPSQFYLKLVTLEDVPGIGQLQFVCNSWVYPAYRYKYDRVFFAYKTYLPCNTPEPLRAYREDELINLRGDGSGMLKEWDRVYDYALYNDLGSPEEGRPVLGGSQEFPYPRRGRTGRRPNKKDPKIETRLLLLNLNIYVPRDERFSQVKFSEFICSSFNSLGQVLIPEIGAVFNKTINEFDNLQDIHKLYKEENNLPDSRPLRNTRECLPWESFKELLHVSGGRPFKFPKPDIIKNDETAWKTDEEFGREMIAGVNPVIIRRLEEFPPASKLDPKVYGNQNSSMTKEQIEKNMNGLTVEEAIAGNKLFILDYHDVLIPYLRKINKTKYTRTYASRTVLLLQDNGTLKPLAIELSREQDDVNVYDPISQVFTPSEHGIENSKWQLAKAYVAVNDSGYHQLISHWLNTHAAIEPFVIATNRQLSVLHPIYKLLQPHFRDTMNINALARHTLINAGGILETTVFPARYSMEMSAVIYKNWNFTEQALPEDLLKRGVAVKDPNHRHGLRLLIEDYPFAVDGLEIWSAIKDWVTDFCSIHYETDDMIQGDSELQSWWTELREEGHGDLKDRPWWPKMQTKDDLIQTCTIIIWVASALHAAVNFGQYPYAGFLPNRPAVSRRFMPDTQEHAELEKDFHLFFLKTITAQFQTLLGVALIEILSQHSTEEIYLGQRDTSEWPKDEEKEAFARFSTKLVTIENDITERNKDQGLRNRNGPVKMPYTLLYPNTSDDSKKGGLTGSGIPNSITI
ncbi:probable linoleate 9S-lipoxygenase 5 isoform X2 [Olea europaea subsp. europaea]|uniref:Lipoxygenase n=1 Tax=Olea europaea subsp. europaea TaxID=158383 RepID=A0A8S0PPP8_OLEEU|nr:probable linoleate 9S-lipoxygenase 5 isoform X2 [Olea europaea subsp. europaea]